MERMQETHKRWAILLIHTSPHSYSYPLNPQLSYRFRSAIEDGCTDVVVLCTRPQGSQVLGKVNKFRGFSSKTACLIPRVCHRARFSAVHPTALSVGPSVFGSALISPAILPPSGRLTFFLRRAVARKYPGNFQFFSRIFPLVNFCTLAPRRFRHVTAVLLCTRP